MAIAYSLVAEAAILMTYVSGLVIGDVIPVTDTRCLVTGDVIPMTIVTRATISGASSRGPVTRPSTLVTSVVEPLILLVCLKNFTFHLKHLKIYH